MKFKEYLKKPLVLLVIGCLIGISFSYISMNLSMRSYNENINNYLQDKIENTASIKRFLQSDKDYIVAGLLLKESNREKVKDYIEKKDIDKKSVKNYYELRIEPIYNNIYKEKIEKLLNDNSELFLELSNTIKFRLFKLKIEILSKLAVVKEEVELNLIEMKVKLKEIESYLVPFSQKIKRVNKKQITRILKDKIYSTPEIQMLYKKIEVIDYTFSDVDDDYHFGTVDLAGEKIDLSFLNIIDLYIDQSTTKYLNAGTMIDPTDDTLIIKDAYINLESMDGLGLDIIIGQINITGVNAFMIYNAIGVINEYV